MKLCAFPWAGVNRTGKGGAVAVSDWIVQAQQFGYDGLEVPVGWVSPEDSPSVVQEFRQRLDDHGLVVGMYNLGLDDWAQESTLDEARKQVDFAAQLGAPLLRMMAQRWQPQVKEMSRSMAIRVSVEGLARVAEFAQPYHISLAIENHHAHVGIELEDYLQILNGLDLENVGVNFDPKHPTRIGCDTMAFLQHPKVLRRLKCTHLDNYSDTVDGWNRDISLDEGDLDVSAVVAVIKRSGYDGWLSIEFGGRNVSKLARSAAYVREVWSTV